jgi:hypothetical protein
LGRRRVLSGGPAAHGASEPLPAEELLEQLDVLGRRLRHFVLPCHVRAALGHPAGLAWPGTHAHAAWRPAPHQSNGHDKATQAPSRCGPAASSSQRLGVGSDWRRRSRLTEAQGLTAHARRVESIRTKRMTTNGKHSCSFGFPSSLVSSRPGARASPPYWAAYCCLNSSMRSCGCGGRRAGISGRGSSDESDTIALIIPRRSSPTRTPQPSFSMFARRGARWRRRPAWFCD